MIARLAAAYRWEILTNGRELRLLSALAFLATFAGTRVVTHTLLAESGGGGVVIGGLHIHHVVLGVILVLASGVLDMSEALPRVRAVLFGAGSALILDEFALVLNLADVYWAPQGRESVDAVVVFAAVLWLAVLGRGFWREVWKELRRLPFP